MAASITAVGALGVDGMANIRELPINAVTTNKPKMLKGLTQNGTVTWRWGIQLPQPQPLQAPANRQRLPHPGNQTERGKPV